MSMPDYSFGNWVKRRRKSLDLSQQELAKRIGCSLSLIFKIESDERRPSRQIADLLARHLEISPDQRDLFLKVARQDKAVDQLEGIPTFSGIAPVGDPQDSVDFISPLQKSNLPIAPNPIVGREHELKEIRHLLLDSQCRLLTLTGPGGVGKTRLALEAARHLQDAFPHGAFFVPLAGISSPEYIIPAIAESIGFSFSGSGEPEMQLFRFLSQKQLLLVIDNMEHLLSGVGLLGDLLQHADQVKLLATSREPLRLQAEWMFDVQGLPMPNSDQVEELEASSAAILFLQRARQARSDFTLSETDRLAVLRISRLIQGLPLGIELAAAWVRTLTCNEIAEEIDRNLDFLTASSRDLPERHRSMTAVFDHSWKTLSSQEQQVLRWLSIFRGGFTREAAEKVVGATLSTLSSLVDKSLVRRSRSGRYVLHELTRQYARERLIETGELETARNQHLTYFTAFVQQADRELRSADPFLWLDRLEQDHDNLRVALEWSLRPIEMETAISGTVATQTAMMALRLASMLYQFWKRYSHWTEGRQWLQRALAQSSQFPGTTERANALSAAALLAVEQADTKPARQFAEESLALSQELGEARNIAFALNTLGIVLWKQKNYVEAREQCEKGLAIFRELEDQFAVADSLHFLGHITINQGDLEAAQYYLDESLELSQQVENNIGIVEALADLGLLAYLQNDFTRAESYLEDSLIRYRAAGLLPGMVAVLNRLGDIARCQGAYDKAGQLYTEALNMYRALGDMDEIPSLLHNLAFVALHQGDSPRASELFKEGLAIQHRMGNLAGIAECLMGIAGTLAVQGQAQKGARLLGASNAMRESVGANLWPANRIEYESIITRLQTFMDEPALASHLEVGRAFSLEQSVAEALAGPETLDFNDN